MNLLFIHSNFPGQFLELAPYLAKHSSDRTVFLTESDNPQGIDLTGVELVQCLRCIGSLRMESMITSGLLKRLYCEVRAALRAVLQLSEEGFKPDVAVVHGGEGFGLYLKTLLPNCGLISYMEWYFRPETSKYLYEDFHME